MALKLIKVAKDFNVGLHTIVEKLHGKGFPGLEEKPTAEITNEMLDVLNKEFQKDIAIKKEAEKLLRPVMKKEPVEMPGASPTPAPPPAPVNLPKLTLPPSGRDESVPQPDLAAPPKEERSQPRRELPQLRVVGRIDLNPPKPAPKPEPKPVAKETPRQAPPPPPAPAPTPKPEAKQEQKPTPQSAAPVAPKSTGTPPTSTGAITAEESAAGGDEFYRADSPQLRGLKVLGRINLEVKKDPPASGGNNNNNRGGRDRNNNNRGGRDRNRPGQPNTGGEGSGQRRDDRNRGNAPQSGEAGQRAPLLNADGTPRAPQTAGSAADDRQKRKRKQVQRPVTAESLQASMSGNQGAQSGGNRSNNSNSNNTRTSPNRPNDRNNNTRGPGQGGGTGQGARPGGGTGQGARSGTGTGAPGANQPREVSQKDIENQIRQTMARMGAGASRKRQKMRRGKRDNMRERAEQAELANDQTGILHVTEFVSVSDLASLLNVKPIDIIKSCMSLGIFVSINQRLDAEIIEVVASEFGHEVQFVSAEEQMEVQDEDDDPADLRARQPIVTVMGHVDHGKTSLLDFIRKANVAAGEAGGITQHIGAYEVKVMVEEQEKRITFLDTPGHEAFTAMRARGAKVTDIAIIVIAADDAIMPQTKEAISHAQAAGVPIVFAINKIDKPGADPERIKNELAQMNLLVEDWGGKFPSQDISAKQGLNIDKLLEKVALEAEILDLKANPKRRATGTVLEASMEKGRGYVTKVLIENGTLDKGDPIIAGEYSGRVRAMFNDRGKEINHAGPAMPVLILGLGGAPQAGEKLKEAASESEAKEVATKRAQILREQANRATKRISLDEIGRRLALGNFKELKLIVKGDVDGSIEALTDSLVKLSMDKIQVTVIHKAVGQIVDSDVMLASASDAIIVGFQVRPSLTARKLAEKEGVEIKMYSIIYEAIEEITAAMEGMLEPTKEEEIMSQVEIRDVFKITKVGTVAGCYVQEGKIFRNHYIRLIRDGIVIYPVNQGQHAELSSLKRFKEDVKEVKNGMECGLTIKNFNDLKVGDVVESYVINEVKGKL
jgi:translation initiation factor IF-2